MAIYPMLKTVSFSPEDVERLATAYENALHALRIVNRADPITVVIARRIIDAAQTGTCDSKELCALAIKDLQTPTIRSEEEHGSGETNEALNEAQEEIEEHQGRHEDTA